MSYGWCVIVETDNFGGDYPDEKIVNLPAMPKDAAERIAEAINRQLCNHPSARRFWVVKPCGYKPQPGFEP